VCCSVWHVVVMGISFSPGNWLSHARSAPWSTYSVLQCVVVYCTVLRCVAVFCTVLQCVMGIFLSPEILLLCQFWNWLKHVRCTTCSVLQHVAMCCSASKQCVAACCSVLQHVAMCCSASTICPIWARGTSHTTVRCITCEMCETSHTTVR